jgi:hypothetical protein
MATKERPILFSSSMVRAILEGRKSQTRRVMRHQPFVEFGGEWVQKARGGGYWNWHNAQPQILEDCPYGKPGDLLWVRETWGRNPDDQGAIYRATDPAWDAEETGLKWKPSIHMPRWASRLTLRITGIRVERVQSISERDASREGLETRVRDGYTEWCDGRPEGWFNYPQIAFCGLWDSINGGKPGASWAENPWVWVVEFEKEEAPHAS